MFRRPTEAAGRKIANQAWVEIGPVPIFAFDQIDLPVSLPLLHCLLTLDCRHHIPERLVVDECVHFVARAEARLLAGAMLLHPADEIAADPYIKRAVRPARHYVDEIDGFFARQSSRHLPSPT